ncbi:glycerol kinase [Striga asiatica]|uniref:Glycerol kinase n=1 Tax=Striga asiatica TaxID=4170 RepID=A0A5A7P8F2_STRAF|nr:glycerol kinase [Striga asiatica]
MAQQLDEMARKIIIKRKKEKTHILLSRVEGLEGKGEHYHHHPGAYEPGESHHTAFSSNSCFLLFDLKWGQSQEDAGERRNARVPQISATTEIGDKIERGHLNYKSQIGARVPRRSATTEIGDKIERGHLNYKSQIGANLCFAF